MKYQLICARKNDWAKVYQYPRCKTYLRANLTRSGSLNTGLTKEDETRLEKKLGYPEGHLSKTNIDFWRFYSIVMDSEKIDFDTENPHDELAYLVLKSHKRVADGSDKLTPSKDFILLNKEDDAVNKNKINRKKRDAVREFDKMTPDQMRKALRVLGVNSANASIEIVESTLYDFIEENPTDFFIKWVENTNRDIHFLINRAVDKSVIRKNKTTYFYGTDVIGGTLEDTVLYLTDKKNSDIRKAIMNAIEYKEEEKI